MRCFELRRGVLLAAVVLALAPTRGTIGAPPVDPAGVKAAPAVAAKMLRACPPIAFIRRASYGMRGTNAIMFGRRTGVGSAICVYDPAKPDAGAKTIFETKEGFIFNMNPSYDGKKLVFSYKVKNNEPFHIWEINVDGSGLRQLTDGRYHDVSPVYYPDGRIIFTSSRVESFSLCQDFLACALYAVDADGGSLRRFDFTTLCTLSPSVMDDGSILCTRWEYQDKNIFGWEGLWTIHPNGRQLRLYHGNTFRVPNAVYGGRQVPGTNKVVVVWAAHHQPPIGDLAMVDRSLGLETPESMWKITNVTPVVKDVAAGKKWRDSGVGTSVADRLFGRAFADPYPFTADYSLVSFGGESKRFHDLYVLNHNTGKLAPLYKTEASCFSAVPLAPRRRPVAIPGDCPQEPGEGTYHVQDVYHGLLRQGVKRGQVKALRIMAQSPKKYNTEGPRYHDHYPIVGQGSYYVKINHGTVPVAANGSVYFRAPSNQELYFQALDADGKELIRMGSVTQITTGESVSCIGCHEPRLKTPPVAAARSVRPNRNPDAITPPPWGVGPVDFVKHVQPVLDKYCVKCHSGATPPKEVDLSGDKTRFYSMAYESLVFRGYVDYYYINRGPNGNFPAMATGSWVSKLTKLLEAKHQKVNVDDTSRRAIYAWIDANVPYYSTWEMSRPHTQGGRDAFARTLISSGMAKPGRKIVVEPWVAKYNAALAAKGLNDRGGTLINLTHPQWSRILIRGLAKSAGGLAPDETAKFPSRADPDYRKLLGILNEAKAAFYAIPRIDMPGAKPLPQQRDFGRTH